MKFVANIISEFSSPEVAYWLLGGLLGSVIPNKTYLSETDLFLYFVNILRNMSGIFQAVKINQNYVNRLGVKFNEKQDVKNYAKNTWLDRFSLAQFEQLDSLPEIKMCFFFYFKKGWIIWTKHIWILSYLKKKLQSLLKPMFEVIKYSMSKEMGYVHYVYF